MTSQEPAQGPVQLGFVERLRTLDEFEEGVG